MLPIQKVIILDDFDCSKDFIVQDNFSFIDLNATHFAISISLKRFRENDRQMLGLPGYDAFEGRDQSNAVEVNGAQHMDLIKAKMTELNYDKDHKPNPSGKLDVFTNMFIDQIQGIISISSQGPLLLFDPVKGPF